MDASRKPPTAWGGAQTSGSLLISSQASFDVKLHIICE
jgi:hypothetical protein